jgi:hypothetical protein
MRRKDKQLLAFVKKKKKKLPFQGKVLGGTARSRPDRAVSKRGAYRHGGKVAAKADADLINPSTPNAPAGGRVAQKFQDGGMLSIGPGDVTTRAAPPLTRGLFKRGGAVKKRQIGGDIGGSMLPEVQAVRAAARPAAAGYVPPTQEFYQNWMQQGGPQARIAAARAAMPTSYPTQLPSQAPPPGAPLPARGVLKRGGAVKRQVGGVLPQSMLPRRAPRPVVPARTDLGVTWGRRGPLGPPSREKGGPVKHQDGGDIKDQENQTNDDEQEDVTEYKRGGVLSAKQRQALPSSSFALPGKGKGPKGAGAGSYPIPDPAHARNALARVSQHGTSEQKAKVRAAVHRKYPSIGK